MGVREVQTAPTAEAADPTLINCRKQLNRMAEDSVKLATLGGECFEATFSGKERHSNADGVVYLFNLNDLLANRGERHVQLFRSGQTKLFVSDYDDRIEIVRINALRRAFDSGKLSFNEPYEQGTYKNLTLDSADFQMQPLVNDVRMQNYIVHKAYWLSYRYGNRLWLMFDEPFDLDYLGATKDDVRRSVWVLSEKQLLEQKATQGVARPTIKLVEAYQSNGAASDETFQRMAIEEAKKSIAEDERPRPKVGVIVVKDGVVLAKAHRGEIPKCHAEFIALEKMLPDAVLTGATVYTTLEPCTTRNHPKVPCATRLTERKVARVVIGMLDPNEDISGRGQRQLRKSRITTDLFEPDLMDEIEELNREFIRAHESPSQKAAKNETLQARITTAHQEFREGVTKSLIEVRLKNSGPTLLSDYRIEVEVPVLLLDGDSAMYVLEVQSRRTPTHRFFRVPGPPDLVRKPPSIFQGDEAFVLSIPMFVDRAKLTTAELLKESVRVSVHAGDEQTTLVKSVAELFEIANVRTFFPETNVRSS